MTDKLASNHSKTPPSKKGEGAPDDSLTTLPSKNKFDLTSNSAIEPVSVFTDNYIDDSSDNPSGDPKNHPKTHPENAQSEVPPDILRIDEKIQALKKKKERIQTQKALLFMKETQKIFKDNMLPNLPLLILTETWSKSSQSQKEEWQKRARSFRVSPHQPLGQKTPPINPTHTKS